MGLLNSDSVFHQMAHHSISRSTCFQFLLLILASSLQSSQALKSAEFLSPAFELEPGSVINKYYNGIDFPTGHIAVKAFDAEVIDEEGNPVPLHETYLHHWLVARYYQRKGVDIKLGFQGSDFVLVKNSGLCQNTLSQYYGLGSETRKTPTDVPDPYGVEVGNPEEIPEGYEEKWVMNVHAIDTRGAEDGFGCAECRCDLYNVTIDEYGRAIRPGYVGGLLCCYDEMKCRLKNGFRGVKRKLFMKYTVKWVDFDESVIPVKVYLLDVTDLWKKKMDDPNGEGTRHLCLVEYDVKSCANDVVDGDCTDTKRVSLRMPTGGEVIYAVAHQHTGGIGSTLFGEDGRVICSSKPTYGKGKAVGDEKGYIVGMSTCYPDPGSVKISDGEILVFESNYSSTRRHTGVMGLFYLLVADHGSSSSLPTNLIHDSNDQKHEKAGLFVAVWGVVFLGAVIAMAVVVTYRRRSAREDGYQSIVI
ncbi:uncharacterized protein LOC124917688 [Impatiens glandulifera]|uniref:uncharacterized protein LOC124917688 n=1 Tax=Impatiens glandulifera TaxID=253017 RepID=UPI001FB17299|nr:uncharacterized protein LOC124917688 [Impatiens glandulifera]